MNSEAASSGSPLRAAVPPKRAKIEHGVQTNRTMQDLDGMKDERERTRKELDEVTKTMLITEDDIDMWKKLFEDCNKKQGEEIERLRRDYKERSDRAALTTVVERAIPERSFPRGQSPMELLTPREMSQTTEQRLPTATDRVTIPDPSDTLGDPVVEQTRLGTVPAVTNYRQQSFSEPGQRTDVQNRLGEAPVRRTTHPRRRLGPVNPMEEATSTSRSDTRSKTTGASREERRPDRGSLMWSRPIPSPWHVYKDELMKLDLQRVSFIEDARRMLNGARLSVSRLYSITGVDWLIAAGINFSSITSLRVADLEGLPSNNTMGPVNARPLPDVKLNPDEGNRVERPGRFLVTIGQHVKMFRQLNSPPGHVKDRIYPKQVSQDGDVQRYGGLKAIKKDETIFAAYDKAEMRKAKIMIVANSEFVYTSKSLFWPDAIMLAAVDLDLLQAVSLAIGVQRQTDMTIVFAGKMTTCTVEVF